MKLTLSISMCPSGSNMEGQMHQFGPEGGTFGRSANNTWVLPDVSRHVSSVHARISVENGQFILNDQSTNGLFVNGSMQALGPNNPIALNNGDQLTFGGYCVQVSLAHQLDAPTAKVDDPEATHFSSQTDSVAYVDDLDKWLEPAAPSSEPVPSSQVSYDAPLTPSTNALSDIDLGLKPEETDPLAALGGANLQAKPLNPSAGGLSDLLGDSAPLDQQMMKVPNVIPSDWDDLLGQSVAPVSKDVMPSEPQKVEQNLGAEPSGTMQLNTAGQNEYISDQEAMNLDAAAEDLSLRELLATPAEQLSSTQLSAEDTTSIKKEVMTQSSPAEPSTIQPSVAKPSIAKSAIQEASTPQTTKQNNSPSDQARNLARQLGLDQLSEAQLSVLETAVADTVKETVTGMMKTLRARSEIKSEFRMNMTTIQSAENNPLKFSVTPEDALENMFAKQGKAYLSPVDAINDGFADISDHQVALFDAMKAAYEHIFGQFDPEFLTQKFERSSGKRFLGAKVKNWDAYQALYSEYKEDNEQTFKRLFGEVFADAYERRMHSLKMSRNYSANNSPNK